MESSQIIRNISKASGRLHSSLRKCSWEVKLPQHLEKAELFNIFGQSVFTSTDYQSKPEPKSPMKIEKLHFTQSETKSALENLDVAKAKGPDGLGNLPLKELSNSLCKSLSLVFNTFANKREYPIAWKTREILPFFKDGVKQNAANYRFISLLSCTSKLQSLGNYEVIKDKIAPEHYGFRKNRSSITQMIMFMSEIFDSLVSTTLATMYLDFEKAFDKVSHGKLLEKLTNEGIRGGVLELVESYLKGGKQKVKIGSSVSSEVVVQIGVPQGSALGPLFFILFINDLPKCVMSTLFGYADDYKIVAKNGITLQIDTHRIWK